jgi:hypothetical protein
MNPGTEPAVGGNVDSHVHIVLMEPVFHIYEVS